MRDRRAIGAVFALVTALTWGGQFVVAKSALDTVNSFPLTTVRYAVAAVLWLVVLALVEGPAALRPGRLGLRLWWLGTLGFAGFNLFAYVGLAHAQPGPSSLVVALAPLLTALVLWRRTGARPSRATFGYLAVALAGVFLVLSDGHPGRVVGGSVGWGVGLVLLGVFSFVVYGLGARELPGMSALRYTALTAALGWVSIAAATAVALGAGLVATPSGSQLWHVTPQLAYLALPGAFVAVLTWNGAIALLGPQNAVLFGNLIPVTTFAIEIARGLRPGGAELAGAGLTVAALVASNLHARYGAQRIAPAARSPEPETETTTAPAEQAPSSDAVAEPSPA